MPLLYLPLPDALFLWGEPSERARSPLPLDAGSPARVELITPQGRRQVDGVSWPVATHAAGLASLPAADLANLSASVVCWVLASKLAVELVARARVVPTVAGAEARWAAALGAPDDAAQVLALARSMPVAAHALPAPDAGEREVWAPDALLRAYLDSVVDSLLRAAATQQPAAARANVWQERWRAALSGTDRAFPARGFGERSLHADLQRWSEPALGARDKLRACFRLELPEPDREQFVLRFMLQSPDDASLLVPASDVWEARGRSLPLLGRAFRDPQESLLEALGRAARLFPPLSAALTGARPSLLELDAAGAWQFLGEAAALLDQAGFGVIVPGELTRGGQRRLRLRMRVGGKASRTAGVVAGAAALAASELVAVDWQAAIGDEPLSAKELAALAAQKAPLVRYRGAWVAIDPSELPEIQARIRAGGERLSLQQALQAALAGEIRQGSLPAQVVASGELLQLLERLRDAGAREVAAPAGLHASLRPYQARGLAWLSTLSGLGLGACLADDMGLGKTLQLLASLLHQAESADGDRRPSLLVAPTSVVGNWEREAARFAPQLQLVAHYGDKRAREPAALQAQSGALVLTTFGLLRRDAQLLAAVDWGCVALDEAQNIKNSASATARAARELRAPRRVALTGTPVENRLAELWSILEFANPGLLGPLERFKREFALPIERYGDEPAAARLRRIAGPFVLRRLKSDPAIIQDLPAKNEAKVICTLTREQASLYKAVLDEDLRGIEEAKGIERRGRVLALLTALKQVCNHPAQYLGERAPLAKRSGKLTRLSEMLEEALAAGDKALVFSQYREMGERLVGHLEPTLGVQVGFLHGGTAKAARDGLVQRFQTDPLGPRVLVLSLKAGGTGLNLTAANHVFHYDRWWNPAVEDQATDRAYRIGQTRAVQVHKFICAGTVEDKVDQLLERKRALAQKVVGSGEQWITELGDAELRELFTLGEHAVVEGDDEPEADGGKQSRTRRSATRSVSRPSRRP
ncbi:MAG TPA: DEAD/DEAH box helicase [Polyangiales bacterium]|nr:DEAD/DEAH box helicase [Polyangiales bacterium]